MRDIKTTDRNGPVIGVACVRDDDELLMMTARGKLQRMVAGEISVIGRNTQGVRIMSHRRRGHAWQRLSACRVIEGGNGVAPRGKISAPDSNTANPQAGNGPELAADDSEQLPGKSEADNSDIDDELE